jgi:hypothetical protein
MMYGGGGGGGGDSTIIIVVLLICCVISALGGFYTCTGGTFDFDKFDKAKCLTIPGDDDKPDSNTNTNNMNSGTWNSENPPDLDIDDEYEYLMCAGTIFPNETRTCYDRGTEGAGIRWAWQETDQAVECAKKVSNWRIDLTSESENHGRIYTRTIQQGTASSFSFKNAPSGFVTGTSVRFRLSGLNSQGNLVLPSTNIELDSSSSVSSCGDVGISGAIDFNELVLSFASGGGSGDDLHLPPPKEDPMDCTVGEWIKVGGCMVNGLAVDPATCGPSCTQTFQREILTPASGGGTCITEKSEQVQRTSCNPQINDPAIDCVVGDWFTTVECSATCGTGTMTQIRPVTTDDENGGVPCPALTRQVACNTQACPINCIGVWDRSGCSFSTSGAKGATKHYKGQTTYKVIQSPNAYGSACPTADGTVRDCTRFTDFDCTGTSNSNTMQCTPKA